MLFKKHKPEETDAEQDFMTIINIVKKYDRQGFNRLIDAIEDCWRGYDKVLRTKTRDEKENADIIESEKVLNLIEEGEN